MALLSLTVCVLALGSLLQDASSLPLCTDLRAPVEQHLRQPFCGYEVRTCCSSKEEAEIKKRFQSMNISDEACSSLVKSIVCSKCDPFSGNLYNVESKIRTVPVLCNSTLSVSATQSKDLTQDFCGQVWDTCKDAHIKNSPFAASLRGSAQVLDPSFSKLTELWQSKGEFCNAFGSSGQEFVCFDGQAVLLNTTQNPPPPKGLCLERLWNGSDMYANFVPHPDGSARAFVANVDGKIWLTPIPEEGSGKTMALNETTLFLDLSDVVKYDPPLGVMGLAFHPNFTSNGRFFVSYNCDQKMPGSCSGKCSCNLEVGCDPAKLLPDKDAQPCQYHSVIAEFTANSTSSSASTALTANPLEVRRIFTMGLPSTRSHGGQLLFGPTDGYLYFMMGDGGVSSKGFDFAQNKKSLLGKIMRLDVDNIPSPQQITELGLWGNYSIPKDNAYVDDRELQGEIWALGLRSPWRCSFDSERPSYFFCADTGEDKYEEVDLISKGGNFGWNFYEGPLTFQLSSSNANSTPKNLIFPILGYNHTAQSASITGGYVYRSNLDPCMFGRYLYADLYAKSIWTATENPPNSGNYTSVLMPFDCAGDSPIQCDLVSGSHLPDLGYIFSFGEDNAKDVYLLANKGIYRVSRSSRCGFSCPIESPRVPKKESSSSHSRIPQVTLLMLFLLLVSGLLS